MCGKWMYLTALVLLSGLFGSTSIVEANRTLTVAKDGSGDYTTIAAAISGATSPTSGDQVDIIIEPGTYFEMLTTRSWVNLIGEDRDTCIIEYSFQTGDTLSLTHVLWATSNTILRNLTLIGQNVKYCIHSDGGGPYTLTLENCVLRRELLPGYSYKAGFGLGLSDGQHVIMEDCVVEACPAIYMHNWDNQTSPCSMTLTRCELYSQSCTFLGERSALEIWLLGSGQDDSFVIHDSILDADGNSSIVYRNMNNAGNGWFGLSEIELIGSCNIIGDIDGTTMTNDSSLTADISGVNDIPDCSVDSWDLFVMAQDWLAVDYNVPDSNAPDPNDLILWITFEGNADDSSLLGNNGTVTGSLDYNSVDKKEGSYSAYFDGVSDYVTFPNESDYDLVDAMTLVAWVKRDGSWPSPGTCYITKGGSGWQLNRRWNLDVSNFSVPGQACQGTTDMTDDAWHHVIGTYDGSTLKLYIDGTLENSESWASDIGTNDYNATIGGNEQWPAQVFKGLIDDVRIYDAALNSTDVNNIYVEGL